MFASNHTRPSGARQLRSDGVKPTTALVRGHHLMISYCELRPSVAPDRRVIPTQVHHMDDVGRQMHSFFIGVPLRRPLTQVEQTAILLTFPYGVDGAMRVALEPTAIRLNGYDCAWYWCADIENEGDKMAVTSSMREHDFLDRLDAITRFLESGDAVRLLEFAAQNPAYAGYFHC